MRLSVLPVRLSARVVCKEGRTLPTGHAFGALMGTRRRQHCWPRVGRKRFVRAHEGDTEHRSRGGHQRRWPERQRIDRSERKRTQRRGAECGRNATQTKAGKKTRKPVGCGTQKKTRSWRRTKRVAQKKKRQWAHSGGKRKEKSGKKRMKRSETS